MLQQNINQSQQQLLSVDQRQSLQILAFDNQELDAFLTEEYMQNPLLECDRDRQSEIIDSLEGHYEYASSYRDHYINYQDEDSDRRSDFRASESSPLRSYLKNQLKSSNYTEDEWNLIDYLINCLDEKGYFTYSCEEIASVTDCPPSLVDRCLNDLKQLEPTGIFSADIRECLLKQLEAKRETDQCLVRIVRDHLQDILTGNLGAVTRAQGISTSECRTYIRKIGELNPRPILNMETDNTVYVIPDILAVREGNKWNIVINDGWMGEYRFNDYYIHMMRTSSDPELKEYFRGKYERARLILASIERRRETVRRVVGAILERQNEYFLGTGPLLPMTMDQLAEDLQISTSTVSRAIKNKYVQYTRPVLLRDLFSAPASDTIEVSSDHVRDRIEDIVKNEDHTRPLSDDKIARILKEDGITISRRTVAKYRLQMGIPDSRVRAYL